MTFELELLTLCYHNQDCPFRQGDWKEENCDCPAKIARDSILNLIDRNLGKFFYKKFLSKYQYKFRRQPNRMEYERHRWHKKSGKKFEGCSRCEE